MNYSECIPLYFKLVIKTTLLDILCVDKANKLKTETGKNKNKKLTNR